MPVLNFLYNNCILSHDKSFCISPNFMVNDPTPVQKDKHLHKPPNNLITPAHLPNPKNPHPVVQPRPPKIFQHLLPPKLPSVKQSNLEIMPAYA